MSIFEERKIDTHCHLLDPKIFPYAPDVSYKPAGQEIGGGSYFSHVMDTYGVQHALLVGPNSGYNLDNRCLLDAIKQGHGRFKGIIVVKNDISKEELAVYKSQGVVGIAMNVALNGVAYYANTQRLLKDLADLDMFIQYQVEHDQLSQFVPWVLDAGVKVLVDHCGRPTVADGLSQSGFQAMLNLGKQKLAHIKLSGFYKFSKEGYPFSDTDAYQDAILSSCGLEQCIWASDWPYLKAPYRLDYGPMLKLVEKRFTVEQRQTLFWDTPKKLFGF